MLPDAEPGIPAWAGQRDDEPFDVRQFLESRESPVDNAAPLYFVAMADVSEEMDFVYAPADWQVRLPQVKALQNSLWELRSQDQLRAGEVSAQEIERVLDAAKPALQNLDAAQERPQCVFVTGLGIGALLPHISAARGFARLAPLQLCHTSIEGNFDEAEQAIRRTLRLSRDLRPRGMVVHQLVSIAIDGMVLGSITEFTLRGSGLDVEQCDRLLALLAEHQRDALEPVEEGLRMDYIMLRQTLCETQEGGAQAVKTLADLMGFQPPVGTVNWEAELTTCNRCYAAALELAAQPYDGVLRLKKEGTLDAVLKNGNAQLVPLLIAAPTLAGLLSAAARDRATLAGTRALIAVRRYELALGKLPDSLESAAREAGLSAIPADPYSGQPLRYKLVKGKPIVYSVGSDQKDDGGLADWNHGRQPGDFIFKPGA